jgi:hypothetical protein
LGLKGLVVVVVVVLFSFCAFNLRLF